MTVAFAANAFVDRSLPEALEMIGQAGFDAVELGEAHAREAAASSADGRSMSIVAVAFGETDCGDPGGIRACGELAAKVRLEVLAPGTLIPDAESYMRFWPLTISGRVPYAIDIAAATLVGFNPNQ